MKGCDRLGKVIDINFKYKVAIATTDEIVVNTHFGHAQQFLIVGIDGENKLHKIEVRKVKPPCNLGEHDDLILKNNVQLLSDCKYVLVSKIGQNAANALQVIGVNAIELPGFIEESVRRLVAYEQIQSLFL